ncbi:right-handed parallel beta-helix repeat-containing protein [Pseudomarimonas salicorniae]|uniref:DUF1565 domain-containing protein n=1 Tax=Pseudomarimonas salicorniae TaxID=2933270 RepID=A0ABT0GJI3_9GAMM|nr:right-handed parallel beta-helix repeat-containing protein [Lysobacter sp. CAU 1642]MCK7594709.1 DUF1565 domain-containing protein [Lysobacter sp. CAU 1642]
MRAIILLLWALAFPALAQTTLHVATDGLDAEGRGSQAQPFATITFALDRAASGDLILVAPGRYDGRIRIRGRFDPAVTIRSSEPYRAQLRHTATVLTVFSDTVGVEGIRIEGFDIAHAGPGAGGLVVQLQAIGGQPTRNITLADNVIHDSFNNDLLKINNGAEQVRVLGNLFYNQQGSDEHIDINSVTDVLVEGNVFFNDFAASGRVNGNDTSSFVVVKDSNGSSDGVTGASNVRIRRNLFFNWQGNTGTNFVLCGEDGTASFEAFDLVVENNLMLGNSAATMRSAFGVKGCRDVVFRANTIAGNLPALEYAFRFNREGANPVMQNLLLYNNIWSDPTGTMGKFSTTPPADTASFIFRRNLVFNGGSTLPSSGAELINPEDDPEPVRGDPGLPGQTGLVTPVWQPGSGRFAGGQARIADVFRDLAERYGRPQPTGAGIGQALAAQMPPDDLLGDPRPASPSLGALEPLDANRIFRDGFE